MMDGSQSVKLLTASVFSCTLSSASKQPRHRRQAAIRPRRHGPGSNWVHFVRFDVRGQDPKVVNSPPRSDNNIDLTSADRDA